MTPSGDDYLAFKFYRYYVTIKTHFTNDKYDIVEKAGRIKIHTKAFYKRRDLNRIRKIANKLNPETYVGFIVANFVDGDLFGGIFNIDSVQIYKKWKVRVDALEQTFENDLTYLDLFCIKNGVKYTELFECRNGQLAPIITLNLRKEISMETVIILESLHPFLDEINNEIGNKMIWEDHYKLIKKYSVFLKFNINRMNELKTKRIELSGEN